ncbi:hypothetical protein SEA_TYPHA_81 [Mycobacterium phage Typha]|uniref:Uncharacterized protein n=1 Tax=Mycobacterium phage Typha TaxID=2517971 RepID=A0A482JDL6_9CAUD|nr:hypothetical protein KCH40_gp088 [Mycobacterium phage Typha]QBP29736.1 hypothetical protein SEA_TYPHA_81 [Mycobacterium phage Typha]URM86523.1 hypothetical protein PBI_HILLTOPFARM_82 [Mycobacterium phage Hilltopfarm]
MMADDLTDQQIADAIAAMDDRWHGEPVRCQCPGKGHGGRGCQEPATVVVERHLVHQCKSDEANQCGNRVEVLCLGCAQDLWLAAHSALAVMHRAAARTGAPPICTSCHELIVRPSDIVRSVKRNDEGVR